ncbi:MAG TPA: ribosome recycling factor [Thermodesulfobacteriota bacterium]|nr:ribosome recycling factor [Deltaproteobacteria bacterium]HNR13293.1 ribosome recycling factor [Thermodesulfobacteriota bacterium]HNU71044.1 ribosome recycling factor [Thermodesulfobacteriota bacterium]HOC37724.1 ribosome recycling factor [Thermodesulfobacteriota bacterium]HQO77140.1 ribosome recycling factor [Thermodesulfobacteriota bacterium]
MNKEMEQDLREKMEQSIRATEQEFSRVRTGRASLSLLDGIKVNYYGSVVPINQVATLSVPESRLITIQPWDTKGIGDIEKAILKSDLGLTPASDGKIIRIPIPALTEERRRDLVKLIGKAAEKAKIALRNIRRDANEELKALKKDKTISEDEYFAFHDEVQQITDEYIGRVDAILSKKEQELMEI